MKKLFLVALAAMFLISLFAGSDSYAWHGKKGKRWVYKGVSKVANNPGIMHYVWETERPPYGPFDKIALHRLVRETWNWGMIPDRPAPEKRKVIFIIPGTWSRGSSKLTDERHSLNIYLANNRYDVYSMDFRTAYVPNFAYDQFESYGIDVNSTADWTYGVFREDIKACVEKSKRISRAKKLFLAGRSRGGTQMFIYASKYWKQDLKGLISLDGGGKITPPSSTPLTEEQYNTLVADFNANGVLLTEVSGYEQAHYAGEVPYALNTPGFESLDDYADYVQSIYSWAPPPPSPLETVSDAVAYGAHYAWGEGKVTNYYGGFIELDILIKVESNFTRYWPEIQNIEGDQLNAYSGDDCPFLDYDDNLANLPMIAFLSELFCPDGLCLYLPDNKTLSDDVTFYYLPGYGHLDVYVGVNSISDVKQPLLEWMNDRR
jgi:pimeloyl-ACP methyl ester carboxylesterase